MRPSWIVLAYSIVSSATEPAPGSGAVVTSSAQASAARRFGMFAIIVWWARFRDGKTHQWVSSAIMNVVLAPSRALGADARDTALPSPFLRGLRSRAYLNGIPQRGLRKNCFRRTVCRIRRRVPSIGYHRDVGVHSRAPDGVPPPMPADAPYRRCGVQLTGRYPGGQFRFSQAFGQ